MHNLGGIDVIYKSLLRGNERFGTTPHDICLCDFKCEPEQIDELVVMAPWWKPDIFINFGAEVRNTFDSVHSSIWNLRMDEIIFTYIRTGIGAPLVGDVTLALGSTPCKKIIFIGSVGALDDNIGIGDIVIPEYSVCGDGICRYLTDGCLKDNDTFGQRMYPDKQLTSKLISITEKTCSENNVKWHIGKNFSVDTVFAQFSHIDEILELGCTTIEMETAAFFKAAEICNIAAGAVFSVSDNAIKKKSLYNGRTDEDTQYRHKVRANYFPQIVLETLK